MGEINKTSAAFAIIPRSVITDARLSGEELRVLALLESYDFTDSGNGGHRKRFVYPSREELAQNLGKHPRRISEALAALERAGFIRRELRAGKVSVIHLLVQAPCSTLAENQQYSTMTLAENQQGSLAGNQQGTLAENQQPEEENLRRESKKRTSPQPPVAPVPEDRSSGKKKRSLPPKDLAELQALLDAVDVQAFRDEFGPKGIDVDDIWSDFTDATLHGTGKKPEPNPYNYKSLPLGFRNWLKKRAKENGTRPDPAAPTNSPSWRPFS